MSEYGRPRRFRCRKGHEWASGWVDLAYAWGHPAGQDVAVCPHCHVELLERECGGVEDVTDEPAPDRVAEGP